MDNQYIQLFSIVAGFVLVVVVIVILFSRKARLNLNIDIGKDEKHKVSFQSETMTGITKIYIDDKLNFKTIKFFNGDAKYDISVGIKEKHKVEFVISMPLIYGAFRQRTCSVFVDGELFKKVMSGS